MSEPEYRELHNKFIKGINLRMIGFGAAALISATFFVRGKVDDLMNYQVETRTISEQNYNKLDRKIDVTRDTLERRIERLSDRINNIKPVQSNTSARRVTMASYNLYTQRIVNGKLTFIPYR